MYCFKKDFDFRYTDVDFKDELKLSSLLSGLEEAACLSADELGFGYSALQPKNIGFIIANWELKLDSNVKLGDTLTVHTWPVKPKKLIVLRDFELFVGGKMIGVATSRWCLVDLKTFNMLPSSCIFSEDMQYNPNRSLEVFNWKIPAATANVASYIKDVSYSDYDHYNHANNTRYADFLMDAFSPDELAEKSVLSVRINYLKQSKFGDRLEIFREKVGDEWIVEARCGAEQRAQMLIKFNERN